MIIKTILLFAAVLLTTPVLAEEVPPAMALPTAEACIGMTAEELRETYYARGGRDLSELQEANMDDWLIGLCDDDTICLAYADWGDGDESRVVTCAVYDKGYNLLSHAGDTAALSFEQVFQMQEADASELWKIAGWGDNFDEDSYFFFLERCGYAVIQQVPGDAGHGILLRLIVR